MINGCETKDKVKEETKKEGQTEIADTSEIKAVDKTKIFVTPEWTKSVMDGHQKESENYIIAEVSRGSADESPDYNKGHIPGALHADVSAVECDPFRNLSEPKVIEKSMLELGITKDTTVILYGLDSGTTRVAFVYLWAGVENVKVLNGGLHAWEKAGYQTETKVATAKTEKDFGTIVPQNPNYWLSIEEAKDKLEHDTNFRLVSIRSKVEYEGKTSGYKYIERAGEPKGAIWGHAGSDPYHMEDYLNDDGTYIGINQVEKLWDGYDLSRDNELSFYCGTGWRATIPWLICYEAGYKNITLYDGGWYQWQMNNEFPVQVGDPRSGSIRYTTVGELSTDSSVQK